MKHAKQYGRKSDLALGMWVKLARAYHTFSHLSARHIARYGLTQPQFAVLEALGHCGPLRLCDLSRKMLVTGGNMTVVVDNLQEEGLVQRVEDPEDRRATKVSLTQKGRRLFRRIFIEHANFISNTASVLSDHEQEELGRLLRKLGRSLAS